MLPHRLRSFNADFRCTWLNPTKYNKNCTEKGRWLFSVVRRVLLNVASNIFPAVGVHAIVKAYIVLL